MKDYKNKYRSQSNRLPGFDYTQGFWYYVTICTKDMINYFGKVENGKMQLNRYGKTADDYWKELPEYLSVSVDEFVIMPNHMHGIIILTDDLRRDLIHQISAEPHWILMKQKGLQLGKVIRHYKAKVARIIRKDIDEKFSWQSNYFEHIIRNSDDLNRIRHYIKNNPRKWEFDKFYPEN